MTFCCCLFRELLEIVHFKGEMRKVRADHYRPAVVKFTNLNLLVAMGSF